MKCFYYILIAAYIEYYSVSVLHTMVLIDFYNFNVNI